MYAVHTLAKSTHTHRRRRWQPLQCSRLENPRDGRAWWAVVQDGGAWWAVVHGGAESRTRLSGFTSLTSYFITGEGNGNPLQYSCPENPMDRGAWRAMVRGVAENWTRLMWLSTHAQCPASKMCTGLSIPWKRVFVSFVMGEGVASLITCVPLLSDRPGVQMLRVWR